MDSKTTKFFIIAGESSGDNLGKKLCYNLKKSIKCEFRGIGGEGMKREGVKSIFPMKEISLMGYSEIFLRIPSLIKRIRFTAEEIRKYDPDCVITIDSPGFCFRVIKLIQNLRAKKIHYVAPSVWIKPQRVKFLDKYYDKILSLLPFEKEYFNRVRVQCDFVGHPAVEDGFGKGDGEVFRSRNSIHEKDIVVTAMLGSRMSEIKRLGPIFFESLDLFCKKVSQRVVVVFPSAFKEAKQMALILSKNYNYRFICCLQEEKLDLFAATNFALVKSGTSSLEVAIAGVPMIVGYKVSSLSALIAKYIIKFRGFVSIVNILAGKEIIPEYIQDKCIPSKLADGLYDLYSKDSINQVKMAQKEIAKLTVGSSSPSILAAESVIEVLK
ncbi:MAG: lipid-A-disaccharide synthase [Rickettsiales bacterium]